MFKFDFSFFMFKFWALYPKRKRSELFQLFFLSYHFFVQPQIITKNTKSAFLVVCLLVSLSTKPGTLEWNIVSVNWNTANAPKIQLNRKNKHKHDVTIYHNLEQKLILIKKKKKIYTWMYPLHFDDDFRRQMMNSARSWWLSLQ